MAENLSVVLGADKSGLTKVIGEAKTVLHDYVSMSKSASEEIRKGAAANDAQVKAYQRVISVLDKVNSGTMTTKQQQKALGEQINELKAQWNSLSNEGRESSFGQSISDTLKAAQLSLSNLNGSLGSGTKTLKQQFKSMTNEIIGLRDSYRKMSEEEKNSAQGQELARKLMDLQQKAGEVKDTISDTNAEITLFASDTPNLDTFNTVIGIGADAMTAYAGILGKLGGDEKALEKCITTVTAAQGFANMMTKVGTQLQSSSILMVRTRQIQEKALAAGIAIRSAAEGKGVVAIKAATIAQKAFNLVAKANPYVLLATAIIAVCTALYAFISSTEDAEKAEEEHQKKLEETRQKLEEQRTTMSNASVTYGQTAAKIQILHNEYKKANSEISKTEILKQAQSEFKKMGISCDSLTDAQKLLVKNTPILCKAFHLQGKAAALSALAMEKYKKSFNMLLENGYDVHTAQILASANKEYQQLTTESIKYEAEYGALLSGFSSGTSGGRSSGSNSHSSGSSRKDKSTNTKSSMIKDEEKALTGSLNKLKEEYAKFQKDVANGKLKISDEEYKKKTKEFEDKINDLEVKLGIKPEIEKGSLNDLKNQLSEIESEIGNKATVSPETLEQIEILKQKIEEKEIELGIRPKIEEGSIPYFEAEIKKLQSEQDTVKTEQEYNEISKKIEILENKIKGIRGELPNAGSLSAIEYEKSEKETKLKTTIVDSDEYNQLVKEINELTEKEHVIKLKLEKDLMTDSEKQLEAFNKKTAETQKLSDNINTIGTAFNNLGSAIGGTSGEFVSFMAQQTQAIATLIPQIAALITAKEAESIAGATASGSSLPFPYNIIAISASVAAVLAQFANLPKFSNGGIIGGSKVGDMNLARVNGGEMILNGTQQKRLFNMLDSSSMYNNNNELTHTIKIKGSDMHILLKNYNKTSPNKLKL